MNDVCVSSFARGRVFKGNKGVVNSLCFHRQEDMLVTAASDDSIRVYDTHNGLLRKTLFSKKYGASSICFAHNPHSVIYASNKGTEHALRYLSLYDNRFLRYFRGHTQGVLSLSTSPRDDLFISSSKDRTVRLWDMRSAVSQGTIHGAGDASVAFDQQGLVFCVSGTSGVLKLFDCRNFQKGPFCTAKVIEQEQVQTAAVTQVDFSLDGKLMLAVLGTQLLLLDAFEGRFLASFVTGFNSGSKLTFQAAFSPDSKYVISGCGSGHIKVWNAKTYEHVCDWLGPGGPQHILAWAPQRMLVASACSSLMLWVPTSFSKVRI